MGGEKIFEIEMKAEIKCLVVLDYGAKMVPKPKKHLQQKL